MSLYLDDGDVRKLCDCGCGQPVRLATYSQPRYGYRRGDPKRFVNGHNRKGRIETRYVVEDRGHTTPCWVWQGRPNEQGYGQVGRNGEQHLAHRYFFREAGNDLVKGQPLDHLCGVRLCVNPEHLEAVTNAENTRRGRSAKITAEDAAYIRDSDETRVSLARRFGITTTHVYRIRRGDSWA